jgi:hypothetical protein
VTSENKGNQDRVERIRQGLLSGLTDRKKKLALLKELVRYRTDPRVAQVLREAAATPINDNMLGYIVRSFGYLPGPQTIAELAPYFQHKVRSVVSNAVKAAASIDRAEAVRLALPVVRGGNPDTAIAAARVLAERCRGECHLQFLEMMFAPMAAERYAAVLYLRWLPAEDGLPLLVEMMRREKEPELYAMIARVLPKTGAGKSDGLARLREELAAKLAEIDAAVAEAATRGPDVEAEGGDDATDEDAARETMDRLPLDTMVRGTRKVPAAGDEATASAFLLGGEPVAPGASGPPSKPPAGTATLVDATPAAPAAAVPPSARTSGAIPAQRPAVPAAPAEAARSGSIPVPPAGATRSGSIAVRGAAAPEAPSAATLIDAAPPSSPEPAPEAAGPTSSPDKKRVDRPTPNARQPVPALSTLDERAPADTGDQPKRSTGRSPVAQQGGDTLPWQKKEEQQRRRRKLKDITQAFRLDELNDVARKRPMVVGLALVLLGYGLFLTVGRSESAKPRPRVNDIVEGALGKVGAKITFAGTLIEVNRDYNILLVRDERQMVVSAYYSDQSVAHFIKGKKISLQGTIREIKSERAFVVQGITATQS